MSTCPYSMVGTLLVFIAAAVVGVGIPLFVLWRDNR